MLVSEVIKDLLEIMRVNGDLEVWADCEDLFAEDDDDDLYDLKKIEVIETADKEKVVSLVVMD
jgi:hypothetical protein